MNLKGLDNAWLDPKGNFVITAKNFFGDSGGWHNELAYRIICELEELQSHDFSALNQIVKNTMTASGHFNCQYAYEYLEAKGWIRLHGFGGLEPKWVVFSGQKINKYQTEAIIDWCIANNKKFENCFTK